MVLLDKEEQRARVYDPIVIQTFADRLCKQAWQMVFTFVICSWRINDMKNDINDAGLYELLLNFQRGRAFLTKSK